MNHQIRKEKIAEAVWQVIRREGLEGVTVRRVAEEAGISLGSLRHYFDSQDELVEYAMRLIIERVKTRIRGLPFTGSPRHDIELVIAEITPLDEPRMLESEVWLAYAGKAVSDTGIRELSREAYDELQLAFQGMIELLVTQNLTKDDIDPKMEARRLHALVDGLVVHHTTYPDKFERKELVDVISYHLDSILR